MDSRNMKLRKIFGSKWTKKERTGGNRTMRRFFIFKLSKYNTDDNIKKEKKNRSLNKYWERGEAHVCYRQKF
jgi:hypothetical protein